MKREPWQGEEAAIFIADLCELRVSPGNLRLVHDTTNLMMNIGLLYVLLIIRKPFLGFWGMALDNFSFRHGGFGFPENCGNRTAEAAICSHSTAELFTHWPGDHDGDR